MAVITTLYFISICIVLLLVWLKSKLSYWHKRGLQSPSFLQLLINIKTSLRHEQSVIDKDLRSYEWIKSRGLKHAGLYRMWRPIYHPVDLDIIKHILQSDFDHFVDRGMFVNEKGDPLGAHLFSLAGKKWRLLRNKLTPTFSSGKMKMMFETVLDCTKGIEKVMDKQIGKPVHIKEIAARFTTDVIGSCAFGIECNSLENPDCEFRRKVGVFFKEDFFQSLKYIMMGVFPKLMRMLNVQFFPKETSDFFMNLTRETIEYREKNDVRRKDFMDVMIQLKNTGRIIDDDQKRSNENVSEEENEITIGVIAAQCLIFFAAGYETSSSTIAFCLYELAKAKAIQDKVRAEIKRVIAKNGGQLTYDGLSEMKYLEQCVNETLRKYPPEPHLLRMCTKEYQIPNTDVILEKGTKVLINSVALQRDPDNYKEPEKFDPDRFNEENSKTRPACSFLSFGQGPRNCIGQRFGMMQTKIGLVAFLMNYEFSPSEKTKEPFEYDRNFNSMTVKGGVWLNFNKIASQPLH
ncbi:probable cytochrome P450 6a14 [Coccinella septempunctata]|uniref:probable cytochrome P450 6a14 n=1 Tax=Coccinella septempunctata TaxID=41139 RepID=UPI001D091D7D|nr:probable cytochrome P450 6a14 [Coccinella septempunctata]